MLYILPYLKVVHTTYLSLGGRRGGMQHLYIIQHTLCGCLFLGTTYDLRSMYVVPYLKGGQVSYDDL